MSVSLGFTIRREDKTCQFYLERVGLVVLSTPFIAMDVSVWASALCRDMAKTPCN